MSLQTALIALALFQIKHLVADFLLQSADIATEKAYYGRAGGLWHAAIHVVATAPILLWLGPGPGTILAILAVEFVVHYHIDWIKAAHARTRGVTPEHRLFWLTLGADQALHQLTYIGIIGWVAI
ncbi:MAG: DUF3307 domain-containing protein [Roseovarius sp.]